MGQAESYEVTVPSCDDDEIIDIQLKKEKEGCAALTNQELWTEMQTATNKLYEFDKERLEIQRAQDEMWQYIQQLQKEMMARIERVKNNQQ